MQHKIGLQTLIIRHFELLKIQKF